MLNSQQLKEHITNWDYDPKGIQQVGIDLNVLHISLVGSKGSILKEKTILPNYEAIPPYRYTLYEATSINRTLREGWLLSPGMYDVIFAQGCKVPSNAYFLIRQRSSLLRVGALIHSSIFDPGFETNNIGSYMVVVSNEVFIEYGARIAQIYGHYCDEISNENLYKGQWQGDQQRVSELPSV